MRMCFWALAGLALVACDRPSEATPAATATASPPATAVEVSPTSRPLGQAEVDAKVKEATPALQNACAEALGAVGDKVMLSVIAEIDERGHVIDATLAGSEHVGTHELNAAMAFVDHLVAGITGEPPKRDVLRQYFSTGEIAEITLLVGHYLMTSVFVSALGITPERRRAANE